MLADDVFKLQHLLDCHILAHREELEEIITAAVKEEQIEGKLAGVEADWVAANLVRRPRRRQRQRQQARAAVLPWLVTSCGCLCCACIVMMQHASAAQRMDMHTH